MKEQNMRFGDYVRKKRKDAGLTLSDVATHIDVSQPYLCEVENRRKLPFDGGKMAMFAKLVQLTEEETALLYDLASRDKRDVPNDIEDIFMYEKVGELARIALRQSKAGNITEEDWKRFIRESEEKNTGAKE